MNEYPPNWEESKETPLPDPVRQRPEPRPRRHPSRTKRWTDYLPIVFSLAAMILAGIALFLVLRGEKTAEEIRTSKQRSFTVVSRMQSAWDSAFDRLIYAMDVLCTLYELAPAGNAEKSVTWGDGVLEDTNMEYQRRWSMVMAGKYKLEKFYAWYFGCTEEEALELIPEAQSLPGGGAGNYPPEE